MHLKREMTMSNSKEVYFMNRMSGMIVLCPLCGKVHESRPEVMNVTPTLDAVFYICDETGGAFLTKSTQKRIDMLLAANGQKPYGKTSTD